MPLGATYCHKIEAVPRDVCWYADENFNLSGKKMYSSSPSWLPSRIHLIIFWNLIGFRSDNSSLGCSNRKKRIVLTFNKSECKERLISEAFWGWRWNPSSLEVCCFSSYGDCTARITVQLLHYSYSKKHDVTLAPNKLSPLREEK